MEKYLFAFLIAFGLSVAFVLVLLWVSEKFVWNGRVAERHIHKQGKVFRTGGLAMILAFGLAIFFDQNLVITPQLYGILAASALLLVVGVWDDVTEIRWKIQLFFQVMVAILVYVMGVRIYFVTNPVTGGVIDLQSGVGIFISALLLIVWIVVVINAMNWLDGIDGLSGGISFVAAVTIFFLSLKPEVNQPPMAIISIALAGSVLGFLIFNFNPSRILAGTAGAMFMGFALATLAVFSGTKIATALLVLALPIIDFVWVIGERLRNGKSIFKPDRNHLHHKLLELGWSQRKINAYFYAVTIAIAVVALNTRATGKIVTLMATTFIMLVALIVIDKKIKKASVEK